MKFVFPLEKSYARPPVGIYFLFIQKVKNPMYHDKFWKYIKGKRQVGNVVNNVIPLMYNLEYLQSRSIYCLWLSASCKTKKHELALYIKFKVMEERNGTQVKKEFSFVLYCFILKNIVKMLMLITLGSG